MNRLQSMLAAGLTTALSAAAVGAFASAQGLFDGGTSQAAEATTASTEAWLAPPSVEIPAIATPVPQVIYKDLEPIVVTRQVFTTASPTAVPSTSAEIPLSPSPDASPSAQAVPDAATPTAPPASPPVLALAPEASPSASASGAFDDHGGDRDDDWDDDDWDEDDDDDDWDDDDRDEDDEDRHHDDDDDDDEDDDDD